MYFTDTVTTGTHGTYKIAIPKGNVNYDISITKPVAVGGTTQDVTFDQTASSATLRGEALRSETYPAEISAYSVVLLTQTDGTTSIVTNTSEAANYLSVFLCRLLYRRKKSRLEMNLRHIEPDHRRFLRRRGLTAGETYTLNAVFTFENGQEIVVGHEHNIQFPAPVK